MNAELFYVLDVGDLLAEHVFSKMLHSGWANALGHIASFAINGALWIGLIAVAVAII